MKNILIITLLFSICTSVSAQIHIGPTIGYDFATIVEDPSLKYVQNSGFKAFGEGYSIQGFSFGLNIEYPITNKFSVSLKSNHTSKTVRTTERGFNPLVQMSFSYYKSALELRWLPVKRWHIGIGPSLNILNSFEGVSASGHMSKGTRHFYEYGAVGSVGFSYKRLLLEATYYNGLRYKDRIFSSFTFKPIQSITVSMSYMFRIVKKRKSRKLDCPRF